MKKYILGVSLIIAGSTVFVYGAYLIDPHLFVLFAGMFLVLLGAVGLEEESKR